jgi:hypothetical protein
MITIPVSIRNGENKDNQRKQIRKSERYWGYIFVLNQNFGWKVSWLGFAITLALHQLSGGLWRFDHGASVGHSLGD